MDKAPRTRDEVERAITEGLKAPTVPRAVRSLAERGPDQWARWDFREDRLELKRWLAAPRAGYVADADVLTGAITVTVFRRGRRDFKPQRAAYRFPRNELRQETRGGPSWREQVASALRACRAEVRRRTTRED